MAPAAIAAHCRFMRPVGTPPNASVFGTDRMTLRDIMWAGWRVNLAAIVIVNAVSTLVLPRLVWAARPARRIKP